MRTALDAALEHAGWQLTAQLVEQFPDGYHLDPTDLDVAMAEDGRTLVIYVEHRGFIAVAGVSEFPDLLAADQPLQ